jgi:two-component system chemotaxis response regulator CheB
MNIRVLIIGDPAPLRQVLTRALEADATVQVCRTCSSSLDAVTAVGEEHPDVVVLDLDKPKFDGIDLLRKLAWQFPVVVCSSTVGSANDRSAEARGAGACSVVATPLLFQGEDGHRAQLLRGAVLQAARRPAATVRPSSLIVLGASTGGTDAIATVLRSLTGTMPPIVIVQHMPHEYTQRFADRLDRLTSLEVKEAVDGQALRNNLVLVAPSGRHVDLQDTRDAIRVSLRAGAPIGPHTPSVDELFHAASRLRDIDIAGVILTGMGADGADGMGALCRIGAMTIAQDEASCTVFGMPREAIVRGAAKRVLTLSAIANALMLWSAPGSLRSVAS